MPRGTPQAQKVWFYIRKTNIFEESLVALRGRFVVDFGSMLGAFWEHFGVDFGVVFSVAF